MNCFGIESVLLLLLGTHVIFCSSIGEKRVLQLRSSSTYCSVLVLLDGFLVTNCYMILSIFIPFVRSALFRVILGNQPVYSCVPIS